MMKWFWTIMVPIGVGLVGLWLYVLVTRGIENLVVDTGLLLWQLLMTLFCGWMALEEWKYG